MTRAVLAVALACWAGACSCPPASALAAALTEEQYARAVGQAAASIEEMSRRGANGLAHARRALEQVPARAEVRSAPGGPALHVDNRPLLRRLRQTMGPDASSMRAAAQRLRSLGDALTASRPPPPANAQELLREVLAGREFRESWWERWQRRATAWVLNLISSLLDRLPMPDIPRIWLLVALWSAIAIAVAIILAAVIGLVRRPRPTIRRRRPPALAAPARPSHLEWLAEAARAAQLGDHREAVRAVHMAAIARLDEVGVVTFDRAATDSRYVWLLRARGRDEIAGALATLNALFARVWYGRAPARPTEYQAAQEQWLALEGMTAA